MAMRYPYYTAAALLLTIWALPVQAASNRDGVAQSDDVTDTRQNIRAVMPAFAGSIIDVSIEFASSHVERCYQEVDARQRRHAMTEVCVGLDIALALWVRDMHSQRPKAYAREVKVTPDEFGNAAMSRSLHYLQELGMAYDPALKRVIELGRMAYADLLAEANRIADRLDQKRQQQGKPQR